MKAAILACSFAGVIVACFFLVALPSPFPRRGAVRCGGLRTSVMSRRLRVKWNQKCHRKRWRRWFSLKFPKASRLKQRWGRSGHARTIRSIVPTAPEPVTEPDPEPEPERTVDSRLSNAFSTGTERRRRFRRRIGPGNAMRGQRMPKSMAGAW